MDKQAMIEQLYSKDTSLAYQYLLELEAISEKEKSLYTYFDQFLEMLTSDQYVIRVRGFRLLCKQAKWDDENKINASIGKILSCLDDEKATAVRQYLASLKDIVTYKKELNPKIKDKLNNINYLKYKDTMRGLIVKDIDVLIKSM